MKEFLIEFMYAILTVALPIIAVYITRIGIYIIDLLKTKIGEQNYKHLMQLAEIAVKVIEKQYGSGMGQQKKTEVKLYLANRLKGVPTEDIEKAIEYIVYKMNKEIKK